jgi:hypothetical protein
VGGWRFRKQRTDQGDCATKKEPNGSIVARYERSFYRTYRTRGPVSLDDWLCDRELELIAAEKARLNRAYVEPRYCECPETLVNGERIACPAHHNCEYVRARSELVPIATERANEENCNGKGNWMRCFADAMEELARPLLSSHANFT